MFSKNFGIRKTLNTKIKFLPAEKWKIYVVAVAHVYTGVGNATRETLWCLDFLITKFAPLRFSCDATPTSNYRLPLLSGHGLHGARGDKFQKIPIHLKERLSFSSREASPVCGWCGCLNFHNMSTSCGTDSQVPLTYRRNFIWKLNVSSIPRFTCSIFGCVANVEVNASAATLSGSSIWVSDEMSAHRCNALVGSLVQCRHRKTSGLLWPRGALGHGMNWFVTAARYLLFGYGCLDIPVALGLPVFTGSTSVLIPEPSVDFLTTSRRFYHRCVFPRMPFRIAWNYRHRCFTVSRPMFSWGKRRTLHHFHAPLPFPELCPAGLPRPHGFPLSARMGLT